MIKVKCRDKEKSKETNYPCLMESKSNIVFFCKEQCGLLIRTFESGRDIRIGQYYQFWIMKEFKPYTGEITLSNDM